MIKLKNLISEQLKQRLSEAPPLKTPVDATNTNYSEMSHEDLWDQYYTAKAAYDAQILRSTTTATNAVKAASDLASSGVDITRPIYSGDGGKNIYLPGMNTTIATLDFQKLWKEAEANGTIKDFRKKTGFDNTTFKSGHTTDNTCAQFACTAFDMGNSMTDDNIGGLLKYQKDIDWDKITSGEDGGSGNFSGGNSGYHSSVSKISKATQKSGNWSRTTSSDFEGDSRSADWWAANIQPGDMILYKNTSGKGGGYDHVAMAGNDALELYQDGSTRKTPGERHKSDNHVNTHAGKEFDIIRYTNATGINTAQSRMDNIQAEIDKRGPLAINPIKPQPLATEPPVQKLATIDTPKPKQAGPGGNVLKKIYKSVKGLGNPDSIWY